MACERPGPNAKAGGAGGAGCTTGGVGGDGSTGGACAMAGCACAHLAKLWFKIEIMVMLVVSHVIGNVLCDLVWVIEGRWLGHDDPIMRMNM